MSTPQLPTLLNLPGRRQPSPGKRLWTCSMNSWVRGPSPEPPRAPQVPSPIGSDPSLHPQLLWSVAIVPTVPSSPPTWIGWSASWIGWRPHLVREPRGRDRDLGEGRAAAISPLTLISVQGSWKCYTVSWLRVLRSWTSSKRTTSSQSSHSWTNMGGTTRSAPHSWPIDHPLNSEPWPLLTVPKRPTLLPHLNSYLDFSSMCSHCNTMVFNSWFLNGFWATDVLH